MAHTWAELPVDRVVRLAGADAETIELSLDPLPDDAPAVVRCRPAPAMAPESMISRLLCDLETVANGLFPAWLPGAEAIDGPGGNGTAAVRALAARTAATSTDFGPFLADLAERALGGRRRRRVFGDEVRAVGLARVIAASFHRARAALLVHVPDGLPPAAERSMLAAYEWFAYHGRAGVWLTGAELRDPDRIPSAVPAIARPPGGAVVVSAHQAQRASYPESAAGPGSSEQISVEFPAVSYPAIAGRPHPASRFEQTLEEALAARPWAVGRTWNQTYRFGPLDNPVRLDLLWPAERCVVEVDGPEHRAMPKYEWDRSRDVRLQLDGFAVLRFTNEQVSYELDAVLGRIEQFIVNRRQEQREGRAGWLASR
jgi:very-short-patch-repair endonuclease